MHFNMVKYFIINNSGNEQAAKDVFQETLIVLFEKARDHQLELKASIKTIIYSISRNLWLKQLRDNKSEYRLTDYENYFTQEEEDLDEKEREDQKQLTLNKCIIEMGDPCKSLLTQFYYFKKSLIDLMEMFNYNSTDTVKTQKYKCLKRLRSMFNNTI